MECWRASLFVDNLAVGMYTKIEMNGYKTQKETISHASFRQIQAITEAQNAALNSEKDLTY